RARELAGFHRQGVAGGELEPARGDEPAAARDEAARRAAVVEDDVAVVKGRRALAHGVNRTGADEHQNDETQRLHATGMHPGGLLRGSPAGRFLTSML